MVLWFGIPAQLSETTPPAYLCAAVVCQQRTLLPRTGRPLLMVRRPHVGERIAAVGWNLDPGPVFGGGAAFTEPQPRWHLEARGTAA